MIWNFKVKVNNGISKVNLSKYQNGGIGQIEFYVFYLFPEKLPENLPDKRKMGGVYKKKKSNYNCNVVNDYWWSGVKIW